MTTLTPEDTMEVLALATKLRDLCQRTGAGVVVNVGTRHANVGFHDVAPDVGDAVGVEKAGETHAWTSYTLCGVPVDVFRRLDAAEAK